MKNIESLYERKREILRKWEYILHLSDSNSEQSKKAIEVLVEELLLVHEKILGEYDNATFFDYTTGHRKTGSPLDMDNIKPNICNCSSCSTPGNHVLPCVNKLYDIKEHKEIDCPRKKYPLNICIFGAASDRISKRKKKMSFAVGRIIGFKGHNLIFGAGSTGVMGAVARGYISTNPPCKPFGITTHFIKEVENSYSEGAIHVIECRTMAERKELYNMADVILVLPGGNGTGDELLEYMTYKQLNDLDPYQEPYWNGKILLYKGGVYKQWINLWEEMNRQKMCPDWKKYVSLVNMQDLEELL